MSGVRRGHGRRVGSGGAHRVDQHEQHHQYLAHERVEHAARVRAVGGELVGELRGLGLGCGHRPSPASSAPEVKGGRALRRHPRGARDVPEGGATLQRGPHQNLYQTCGMSSYSSYLLRYSYRLYTCHGLSAAGTLHSIPLCPQLAIYAQ